MTDVNSFQNVSFDVNNFNDMLQIANTSGAGYLFAGITYLIFFVMFITLSGMYGWEAGLLVSSFVGFILGLLLNYAGVMNFNFVLGFLGLMMIAIIYIMWNNRNN